LTAEVIRQDGAILVKLSGELDLANAEGLRETLVHPDVLSADAVRVDLTRVTFLESTTIGLIVSACKRIRGRAGNFSVICEEGTPRRALEVTGLVEYLQIERDAS
jgi:anti-sigma B factor antagonist